MERQRTRQPPEPKRVVAATKASPCAAKPAGYRRPACRQQQCCTTLRGTLRTYASSSCRKLAPAASSVGPCNLQRRTPAVVAAAAPHAKRGGGRLVASPRVILALPVLPAVRPAARNVSSEAVPLAALVAQDVQVVPRRQTLLCTVSAAYIVLRCLAHAVYPSARCRLTPN
jgi:hypothetical protein